MRIQHNIMAMNAYRNFSANTSALSKNLEKLSSGYKINRAGDDAAGLAISEKMRAQITGLETAQKNAKDGISLVQTAEGALTEVHDMLNRMYELAEQSANGTYDDTVDRANLQKEISSLSAEINRIADSANFNGINLLDGKLGMGNKAISEITSTQYEKAGSSPAFEAIFGNERVTAASTQVNAEFSVSLDDIEISGTAASGTSTLSIQIGDKTLTIKATGAMTASAIAQALASAGGSYAASTGKVSGTSGNHIKIDGHVYEMAASGGKVTFTQVDKMKPTDGIVNPDFQVSVTGNMKDGQILTGKLNPQVQVTKTGIPKGASEQARVDVKIDFSKLKDGDTLTVGSKTYIFRMGEDSTVASNATNAIDLTEIFKKDTDVYDSALREKAMVKITESLASNGQWSAGNGGVNGNTGTLTFQSLSSYDDGDATIAGTTKEAKMDTEKNVMAQFSSNRAAANATTSFKVDVTKIQAGDTIIINDKVFEFTNGSQATGSNIAVDLSAFGIADGIDADKTEDVMDALKTAASSAAGYTVSVKDNVMTLTSVDNPGTADIAENKIAIEVKNNSGLTLQIGDTAQDFNKLTVSINDMHTAAMGIGNIDISNQKGASEAMAKIKDAINYVSSTRGDLGATQNRLEHTINNLSVMQENIQDAESTIRDTDVAQEMMSYTKNNILIQSAQAMLAQANQVPQGVLQLLQ